MALHEYFARITPNGELSFDDLIDTIENLDIQKYFICSERASQQHYHLCLWTPRSSENLRWNLKQLINATIYISGKEIENKVRAIAYCMKDGNYREKNIDVNTWLLAKQTSFKKTTYEEEYAELLNDTVHSIEWIAKKLVQLYVKYNKKIYRQHLKATVELIKCKRCGSYQDELVKYLLDEY